MLAVVIAAMLQQPLPLPRSTVPIADTSIFRRLELPAPNTIRTGAGAPGPNYWQQRVDYTISVTLDPLTHRATGHQVVTYHNNSPDSLRYLWFQVDQNLFRSDSRGSFLAAPDARFAAAGFEGGIQVTNIEALRGAASRGAAPAREQHVALSSVVNGTMMRIDLDRPLAPHAAERIAMDFAFNVPEHGADRMGREQFRGRWLYEMAQWQPRAAVYDDVRGWNTEQYLGQGEFYREFGDFDYAITVPRDYIVLATGTLQNKAEVLTAEEIQRLNAALRSDTTIPIVSQAEAGTPAMRPAGASPTLTWRFRAQNVHDVAWATAPNFIWDASGWNGILMQSFYPDTAIAPDSAGWRQSTKMVRYTISHYSQKWFQYPYPTAINIAGPVQGMEYPMIVFCGWPARSANLYNVTTHELGHQWFPMIVSSNERLYAWMDEGFNTFINIFSEHSFYSKPYDTGPRGQAAQLAGFMRSGYDEPIITPADRLPGPILGAAGYFKPGGGLFILRHAMLEDSTRFDSAFREYIRRWAFRHPTPADFFRTMDDNLGEDLSYFWRGWFLRTDRVDLAIDSTARDSSGATTKVFLSSPGTLPMPVDLRVTYNDGATDRFRLPVEVWFLGNRYIWLHQFAKPVGKIEIDPDMNFPDVNRANNSWPRTAPTPPTTP